MSQDFDYTLHYRTWHPNTAEHAKSQAQWFVRSYGKHLPVGQGRRALDVGCGMGFAMMGLVDLGYDVEGIDIDQGQIASAKARGLNVHHTPDTREFFQSRLGAYDLVMAQDVLEHVPVQKQIEFAKGIGDSLAPGGLAVFQVPNANSPLATRWRYIDYTHTCSFTEHSVRFVLLSAGFRQVDILPDEPRGKDWWRLWSRHGIADMRRRMVRFCLRQVIEAELGRTIEARDIRLDLNLRVIARRENASRA